MTGKEEGNGEGEGLVEAGGGVVGVVGRNWLWFLCLMVLRMEEGSS
jgi:hypothetical protein